MNITPEIISQLKQQFGDVFTARLEGIDFVFRALTIEEYNMFTEMEESSADIEDVVVMNAVLFPHPVDLNRLKPGSVTALSNEILDVSGFVSMDTINSYIEEAREWAHEAIPFMQSFIIAAMPTYNKDHLNGYTLKDLTKLVGMAEMILEMQSSIARGETLTVSLTPAEQPGETPTATRQKVNFKDIDFDDLEEVGADLDKPTRVGTAMANDPIAQKLHAALR